jgi:hypothetical protein
MHGLCLGCYPLTPFPCTLAPHSPMLALRLCLLVSFPCSHLGLSLSVLTIEWTAELELESPESGMEQLTPGLELFAPRWKASEGVRTASKAPQNISNMYKAQRGG